MQGLETDTGAGPGTRDSQSTGNRNKMVTATEIESETGMEIIS